MVTKCQVLSNNELVTVVLFNGEQVQLPAIHRKADTVNVKLENGRYTIVGDDYLKEPTIVEDTTNKPRKKGAKKTTDNESAIKEDDLVAEDNEWH